MKLNKTVLGTMLAVGALLSPSDMKAQPMDYSQQMTTVTLTLLNLADGEEKTTTKKHLSDNEIKVLLGGLCALVFVFGARAVVEVLSNCSDRMCKNVQGLKDVISEKRKSGFKKTLNMAERAIDLNDASKEERQARETFVEKSLRAGRKRSEINVQDLRDAEG